VGLLLGESIEDGCEDLVDFAVQVGGEGHGAGNELNMSAGDWQRY
jgi:hypothetical protein